MLTLTATNLLLRYGVMHNRNMLHDGTRSPWGSAWHLQPEPPDHPSGPIPIGPLPPIGSIPDDPSSLGDPMPTGQVPSDPAPGNSVWTDPTLGNPTPTGSIPIGPASSNPAAPVLPATSAEPTGEDLERWFWTESEALADLGPKSRFRSLRRLFRNSG